VSFPVFSDYPDKVSAIIWTAGCNLRCTTCYNKSIVNSGPSDNLGTIEELIDIIGNNYPKYINGLVITGGEPMLHQLFLYNILYDIQNQFPLISFKLDTNLSLPNTKLLEIVDGVSFSLKKITDFSTVLENLKILDKMDYKELRILLSPEIDYIREIEAIKEFKPSFTHIRISKAQYINDESNFFEFLELSHKDFINEYVWYKRLFNSLGFNGIYLSSFENDVINEVRN